MKESHAKPQSRKDFNLFSDGRILNRAVIFSFFIFFVLVTPGFAGKGAENFGENKPGTSVNSPGIYFYRIEPSFYTGFAPRCQDPRRIQIHLGRGNQLRVTIVLSNRIIDNYLPDLTTRYRTYEKLIKDGTIVLTQNTGFEKFQDTILGEKIPELAGLKSKLDIGQFRKVSLDMLKKLNPGRIFHIRIDLAQRIKQWSSLLKPFVGKKPDREESLDLINSILPTRIWVTRLSSVLENALKQAITHYALYEESGKTRIMWKKFFEDALKLFQTATQNIYPITGKMLDFYEFTAIYPVGTLNEFAKYDGMEMPLYPCPGERQLTYHQRTRVVDHIPTVACYGYLPWIPYMHVGKKLHNSFHTLWFNIDTRKNEFIPESWRENTRGSRTGKPYPHLWLLSRGPMSHGCTHVNAGHISELRQMLPSAEKSLGKVVTYRNKSNHFDVFDIDGDGNPEVMGIKYFHAYSLKNKKPYKRRAPAKRKPFYKWLYQKGYHYDDQDRLIFEKAKTSRFLGKRAVKGGMFENIPLYEADYTPETIQFYKQKAIPFVRELRRISSTYDADKKILKLDQK